MYDTGYAGCIHYFGVHNHHVSKIEEGEEGGKVMGGRSYGGQVDFSNFHLNRDSEGAVSSELCILEDRVTEEPTTTQKPQTARCANDNLSNSIANTADHSFLQAAVCQEGRGFRWQVAHPAEKRCP